MTRQLNINPSARTLAQSHFRTLRLGTPFQPRIDALAKTNDWYNWAGYRAPHSLWDEELEYFAIRNQAALFDISPMTKYRIEGPDAEAFLNRVTLRDVTKLKARRVHYTAWCDDEGFVLDDGTLFRLSPTRFRLCSQERHLPWLLDSAKGFDVTVEEETEAVAGLALQGPTAFAVLREAGFAGVENLKVFDLADFPHDSSPQGNSQVTISRTGFTGDLGYELFVPSEQALSLWDRLMAAGELRGIRAIGYTALNRARLEAGLIVANSDFVTSEHAIRADRLRMPDEIGLGFMVDLEKGHFNGRRAILEARARRKLRHVLVGLEIEGNIPAEHAIVYYRKSQEVGLISAATWSPMAKRNIAIASLARSFGDTIVDDLWVEIYAMRELQYQKLMKRAKVVPRPFIRLDRRTANPPADF
ncbi:aminomethyltransferase family protein [Mesorhizobium sp.]|uniref:aminomethyltransferase family protein n=1 Tax=Mesorhizobium sp. TaxID=1871066 RepID=UPI00122BBB64|nr:aminomethyltransferase family protein [Mesorhizobium sp.]TIO09635.1 MAG: aminomethyl transferase family protein [Mesorhizobium sp.]TIO34125.1 MAG: aminomethyl transferase family protein [Mesorhizobium sp.]TIP11822.1 MAG: aminomethyl transferase family protein [Mesorhizobium sp.]